MAERLRRAESRAQTRLRLLDAAAHGFTERGFVGTSVEDIAAAAGYSKGAVYANFESKEALFLALFDRCLDEQEDALHAIVAQEPDPIARIAAIGQWIPGVAGGLREWHILATEFWLHAARTPSFRVALAARHRARRESIAALIEDEFARDGRTPPLPAMQIAALVVAMIGGVTTQQVVEPDDTPLDLYTSGLHLLLGDGAAGEASTRDG